MPSEAPSPATKILSADGIALHWERGYRCHGLWTDDNRRVGVVGIGPRRIWKPSDGYSWQIDEPLSSGTAKTLRDGKDVVERAAREVSLRARATGWS